MLVISCNKKLIIVLQNLQKDFALSATLFLCLHIQ